ncbi:MAG: int13, partial [Actinoallomurus sp.]|nr:int13 [Actinoallomurus sp.]
MTSSLRTRARRVGIYVRISDDREGAGLGVKRQEEDCRALAEHLGWKVIELYTDNDVSAFKKKRREDYERMLTDIRSEHIDGIIAWHTDRLHRSPRELEDFIEIVERYGVEVHTCRGGQIDLSTASGRMFARQLGSYARYESEIKSERILGKVAELVRDGKIHNGGVRPYGFDRLYQGEGPRRKILGDVVNEEEAAHIREWKSRALENEKLYSIVKDANDKGIVTSTGGPWTMQAMRLLLISGRIAGLKEHHRQVVGKAEWDAIITPEEHRLLRAKLGDPRRFTGGLRGARKYPLSGLLRCSCRDAEEMDEEERLKTLARMGSRKHTTTGRMLYGCPSKAEGGCGGRTIKMAELEDHITDLVLAHLETIEAGEPDDSGERVALENRILRYEQRLQALREEFAEGEQSAREYREAVALIHERIADT